MCESNAAETSFLSLRSGDAAVVEAAVTKIWAEILGTDDIGVEDTLFDLGGDSVQAMQIVARIRQTFGLGLPVATIFDGATPRSLGQSLVLEAQRQNSNP